MVLHLFTPPTPMWVFPGRTISRGRSGYLICELHGLVRSLLQSKSLNFIT